MPRWFAVALVTLSLLAAPPRARAAEQVDLLLVLAADVSRSIDDQKFELERRGYAAAFSDPLVLQAIASGPNGRIAIAFVEWAGANSQKLVIDWTLIKDGADAKLFAGRLLESPRSFADRTAIGGASISHARNSRGRLMSAIGASSTCRETARTIADAMCARLATRRSAAGSRR